MNIKELITVIEATAPLAFAASWDRSGLQVAAGRETASHLGVCLDPTPASIEQALAARCDVVLSHHPLSLKPELPNRLNAYHRVLSLLLGHDLPLYAAHTSLDTNLMGPSAWLADELGLKNREALEPVADSGLRGFGLLGTLPERVPAQHFLRRLMDLVPEATATIINELPATVGKVAYCTGSGASLLPLAEQAHADVYISGDIKYHAALDATICVIDVGHHSLEEEMMRRFSMSLAQEVPQVSVTFIPSRAPFRLLSREIQEGV